MQRDLDGLLAHLDDPLLQAVAATAERINRVVSSAPPGRGTIPAVFRGRRYELGTESSYVLGLTPSTDPMSVEFVLYAIDPASGQPVAPLTPVGLYRLGGTVPVTLTVERNGGGASVGGSAVFTSNAPLFSLPDIMVQGAALLPDGARFDLTASDSRHSDGYSRDLRLTSGLPEAVSIRSSESHGPAFDSRSDQIVAGADRIDIVNSSVDFMSHVYVNDIEVLRSGDTLVKLSSAEKELLVTALEGERRSMGLAFGLAAPVMPRSVAFPGSLALWVEGVLPDRGPLAGGTAVTIRGQNLPATVDSVGLGPGRLQGLTVVSAFQLLGTTPAVNAVGAVDVTVYTSAAGSATCSGCFGYKVPTVWDGIAAGWRHACGHISGGSAFCWGDDGVGQLGDGLSFPSSVPVPVSGGFSFQAVTAGRAHACGLTNDGVAYCWGENEAGQAGDGTLTSRSTPVAVVGGLRFVSLGAGDSHTCGFTSAGVAYCWGSNTDGQLGNGTNVGSSTPVPVAGGVTLVSLTAGGSHTCGLTGAGGAYCWGSNAQGELGNGSNAGSSAPVPVAGGITFASLTASGGYTCGLTVVGAAYCWGANGYGQLGNGSTAASPAPVPVAGGISFATLTAGGAHTCGNTSTGAAYCWGQNGGALGDSSETNRPTPVPVAGGLAFASLTAGYGTTCGVTGAGQGYCWGANSLGELGDGSQNRRFAPVPVVDP